VNSDWDCLARAQKGDENAWRWLIEQHNLPLIKMTFLITGSMSVARDLVQETFVRLLRHGSKHREGNFKSYLSTIAYRLALKEKKRSQRNLSLDTQTLTDSAPSPLNAVLLKERDRYIASAIHSLDEHHKDILILRFYGNHSYDEIAQMTDLPIGTVKSRIFYAVKACRKILQEKGIFDNETPG
jgi:RNA polymerase sigma-70 factor (ECF subfamily)